MKLSFALLKMLIIWIRTIGYKTALMCNNRYSRIIFSNRYALAQNGQTNLKITLKLSNQFDNYFKVVFFCMNNLLKGGC